IEEHFGTVEQSRFIEFLFATSTLSYGVNLSVDCVVLTMLNFPITNRFGDIETKQLSVHEFHNMLGRTGRYGLSNRGIGIIVGDMVQIDPMDDIISHYYRKPNQPATELLSALVVPHDQRLADKRASIKKGGMFSNPFIRTVLDVLRHAEQKNGNTARPVSIDEVTSFLEKSYHSQMNGGGVTQVQLRNSISSIFEFCTEKDIKIITSTPSRHTDGEMLYGTNALTNAIIDTGTEITTLEPLLRWNGFLTENVRREGNPMHNNWVPELHFIGLLLSPEAWRIGWEFAPEHREDFPSDEHVVALNRMKVMEEAAAELKQLGLNRPTDVLNIIVKHIREQFSDLGVKLPYENAHVEIVLRLFTALCRWVSGQPLPKIEASSRANVGGSNLDGRSERITNLNQRMSWLAVAMYRCVVFKEGQVSIDNNEGPSPDSLLRLSQRLRTGCPSDALPLFGRKRSQLGRHHATALIEAGFNVDTLLSHQPDLAISLIHETLENKGLHLKDGTGADLLSDLIDLTLVDDKNLAFRMERHHEEGPRLDLRDAWQKVNQRRSELFATTQHIDATKEAIIQHMKRASELLLTLESSVVEAGHQTRLTLSVNGSFELPVAPPNAFTFNFCFTRPMARIVDVGTNRKFTHLCLPPAELMNQVGAIPVSNVTFVVGIPWFLPNAMNELHIKLTTNDPNRRWILISISGYFSLLTLLIRGFIALDSFREGLDTFQKGVNTLRVSHIPHHFATRGLLADIREAMEEHREVVLQRRERTAVQ
ncbi:MAG TPA: hypothetical protein HPQ00_09500, partial [Magnetococcales bacterium]|nr:hypothetical protein [Magnetococcales bacterium]